MILVRTLSFCFSLELNTKSFLGFFFFFWNLQYFFKGIKLLGLVIYLFIGIYSSFFYYRNYASLTEGISSIIHQFLFQRLSHNSKNLISHA